MAAPIPYFGEAAALGAALMWAGSICAYRSFGASRSAVHLNLLKSVVATTCLLVSLLVLKPSFPASAGTWLVLGLSGIVGLAVGDTFFFAALRRIGAQPTAAIQCLAPPVTAGLGYFVLGEGLSALQVMGLLLTTGAVAAVIGVQRRSTRSAPAARSGTWATGIAFGVFSAFSQAAGLLLARSEFPTTDVFAGTTIRFVPAAAVLVLWTAPWRPRKRSGRTASAREIAGLTAAAFAGTFLGVLLLSAGTKYAKAGVVAAVSSTYPVWIVPIARVFLSERFPASSAVWTAVAVAGVAIVSLG